MGDTSYAQGSAADLAAVTTLLASCDLPFEDLRPGHMEHFVLCRHGERVVGTVGLEPLCESALLRSLAVAHDLRGRRLGHELWAHARDRAAALGIKRLYLLTTTAEELFAGWGFSRVPRDQVAEVVRNTTQYSGTCPNTPTVMAMDLPEKTPTFDQPRGPNGD